MYTCKRAILDQICSDLIFIHRNDAEVSYRGNNFVFVKFAMSINPNVRIILPSKNSPCLHYVLKDSVHQTSVAAPVTNTIFFWIALPKKKKKRNRNSSKASQYPTICVCLRERRSYVPVNHCLFSLREGLMHSFRTRN